MKEINMKLPTPLRQFAGGKTLLTLRGESVRDALLDLEQSHEGIRKRIIDDNGAVRNFINIFIDGKNIRGLQGLDSPLNSGSTISVVSAIAGG